MAKNTYQITLENCRNITAIDGGSVGIARNTLNVFYGKNGIGKTTLIRSLSYIHEPSDEVLKGLESFGYQETGDALLAPSAISDIKIRQLFVFNDEWINSHCFKQSNIHENAYELYVRNSEIEKLEKERLKKLGYLRKVLISDEVKEIRKHLTDLIKKIGKVKTNGDLSAAAPIAKAFKNGVPTEPLPKELKPILRGLDAIEKASWMKWRTDRPAIKDDAICPYCGIEDSDRQKVCRDYDASRSVEGVKQWQNVATAYSEYRNLLTRSYSALLGAVVRGITAPTQGQMTDIARMVNMAVETLEAFNQIDDLLVRQESLNAVLLVAELKKHAAVIAKCDLFSKTSHGVKTNTQKAIDWTTDSVGRIAMIQADIDVVSKNLMKMVRDSIEGHETQINAFLQQCGYPYEVSIDCNVAAFDAQILLKPTDRAIVVSNPNDALSYGERNALALMLFMYEVLQHPNALIVLDDPISSFDYDKRYGILYALFSQSCSLFDENLASKTVLVTTHDPLVLCDLIKINVSGVGKSNVKGQFLVCDKSGVLHTMPLDQQSMAPFTQILRTQIEDGKGRAHIFGYVRIRRLAELLRKNPTDKKTKQGWTFSLLSDIIHGRNVSEALEAHGWTLPDDKKVSMCENYIRELTGWDIEFWDEVAFYSDCMEYLIELYKDPALSSEERLMLVRLMIERDSSLADDYEVLKRFADEACHIGGGYLFQLDGTLYDQVPFYVAEWCDSVVSKAERIYVNHSSEQTKEGLSNDS